MWEKMVQGWQPHPSVPHWDAKRFQNHLLADEAMDERVNFLVLKTTEGPF